MLLPRFSVPVLLAGMVAVSGCRTPISTTQSPAPYTGQVVPVTQSTESPAVVPAIEQVATEPADLSTRAEQLWNRIRPSRRISLPRTDFWQDDAGATQLEPVDDFGTGF